MKNLVKLQGRAVLVTGGAGYIGSHTVTALIRNGADVYILDNLSTGFRENLHPDATFVEGDIADTALVGDVIRRHQIRSILHFAGSLSVEESVREPLLYYKNNTSNTRSLIELAISEGVEDFIFSSTATVYAEQLKNPKPLAEDAPLGPVAPYGMSKYMSERIIVDACAVAPLRYGILRYFNVAGADPEQGTGQRSNNATHLIKVACETMVGKRSGMSVFGDDYPTPDGTCIRDYIHVLDLADAHIHALAHMIAEKESVTLNCGYGRGSSVWEVLHALEHVAGRALPVKVAERRAGDTPYLVADVSRIKKLLGWTPRHDNLEEIVASALAWEELLRKKHKVAQAG